MQGMGADRNREQKPNRLLDFERDAASALNAVRSALAEILGQIRPPVRRASDLRRDLELGQSLSWRVFSAATSRDSKALPYLLPGRRGMERFFEAVAVRRVPDELIDRGRAAFERFERVVARHAGTRDAFETMVAELNGGREDSAPGGSDLRHRRAAFRANALLWGRRAELSCAVRIMGPGSQSGCLDGVLITGVVGLQRTRFGMPMQTTVRRWSSETAGRSSEPLDPWESDVDSIGLLHDYCSQPLPEFRLTERSESYRKYELPGDKLGAASEVTLFAGEVTRDIPCTWEITQFRGVGIPMAMYVGDILVHKGVCEISSSSVQIYRWPLDGPLEFRKSDLLPLSGSCEYLGEGIDAAQTVVIPRYSQLLAHAMERMAWDADEFHVFRCLVEYPLLHTRIKMTLTPVAH